MSLPASAQAPPNDLCAQATAITGEGSFSFDNAAAETDGAGYASCFSLTGRADIAHDLWYCWTSTCDGPVTIDTCGTTTVDTKVAVFEDCGCPTAANRFLDCDDDACVYQSSVTFDASAGQSYLIELGTNPELSGGPGTFTISCGQPAEVVCETANPIDMAPSLWDGWASEGSGFAVADNFVPAGDKAVDQICWWGMYEDGLGDCSLTSADQFEVRYYADAGGLPGALIGGPFTQAGGGLAASGPARTDRSVVEGFRTFAYSATHAPVSVAAGMCYWVEITNPRADGCTWYWSVNDQGREHVLQDEGAAGYDVSDLRGGDQAFELNIETVAAAFCHAPPANDACEDGNWTLIEEGETRFDTTLAQTEFADPGSLGFCQPHDLVCCHHVLGSVTARKDIWYRYEPVCGGLLRANVCDAQFDTKLSIWDGRYGVGDGCPSYYDESLACSDDDCGDSVPLQSQVEFVVEGGEVYYLRVGGYESERSSNCFAERAEAGCDDADCESLVCAVLESCCTSGWGSGCVDDARNLCVGASGVGTLVVELVAPPPVATSLVDFAGLSRCISDKCDGAGCDPPVYGDECCLRYDFDGDGDVDLDDHDALVGGLTGPP